MLSRISTRRSSQQPNALSRGSIETILLCKIMIGGASMVSTGAADVILEAWLGFAKDVTEHCILT